MRAECGVQGYFLWQHLLATLQRISAGVGIAIITGIPLGFLLGFSRTIRAIIEPYLAFLRALPPLGYIGLLIVWFGIGDLSKGVLLFLAALPIIVISTLQGVLGIRKDWILAARTLGASKTQVTWSVIMPGSLPETINGIRLVVAMCWAAIVAAEMNDGIPGIGGLAYVSGTQLNTSLTIACIVVIGTVALLIDQALIRVEHAFAPWKARQ
ncbi:ABC transporter permease [Corynebacterium auriscanis]|uniref:ABC transporter permease n=1 Tax=Corynebacterium auriscanis TaxID=99807 RepID=UPI003CF14191